MDRIYDLLIIGSGPAGLSASIYASRYKLEHLIFGVEDGGQMSEIGKIENWPGEISISGYNLIEKFREHCENYGVRISHESVSSVLKNEEGIFVAETSKGKYFSKTLIMAMGAEYRRMNIPGEKEFIGKGVSYCATCDAMFFRGKTVSVVGGGNSAAVVALELADFAKKVYLVHKKDRIEAEPVWVEKIDSNSKIEAIRETDVIEISGKDYVDKIILDKAWNDQNHLDVDGVFIEIGSDPGVALAKKIGVETDDGNYIKTKEDMSTNVPGVFAAGDITTGSNKFRQILTACSEGAIAANGVYKFLKLK
jgi:thioredoxin reductase (NADPH)